MLKEEITLLLFADKSLCQPVITVLAPYLNSSLKRMTQPTIYVVFFTYLELDRFDKSMSYMVLPADHTAVTLAMPLSPHLNSKLFATKKFLYLCEKDHS